MIGIAVYLNGRKLTVAGAEDLSVLSAIVNAVGRLGTATSPKMKGRKPDLWLSVSGLTSRSDEAADEHYVWLTHRRLRAGDQVTVRIVETDRADDPVATHLAAPILKTGRRVKRNRPAKAP